MNSSIEAAFLHKVIEDRIPEAIEIVRDGFLNGELAEFSEQLGRALRIVNDEINTRDGFNRRVADWNSVADTGALNIIRGTE